MKKGDLVKVKKGKFRGWVGSIFMKEKAGKYEYYDLFPRYRPTRHGNIDPRMVGLAMIINVEKEALKKVI